MKQLINSRTNDSLRATVIKILRGFKQMTFCLCAFLVIFVLFFELFNTEVFAYSDKQNNKLIERISKDYTKKFCNGIGFGLSKDSAMNFANKENNLTFQNKKGIESINKELLANKIAILVIDTCGYPINLKGEEGIKKFENEYISTNHSFFAIE